jgi:hypothetical protein
MKEMTVSGTKYLRIISSELEARHDVGHIVQDLMQYRRIRAIQFWHPAQ